MEGCLTLKVSIVLAQLRRGSCHGNRCLATQIPNSLWNMKRSCNPPGSTKQTTRYLMVFELHKTSALFCAR